MSWWQWLIMVLVVWSLVSVATALVVGPALKRLGQ